MGFPIAIGIPIVVLELVYIFISENQGLSFGCKG